MGTVNNELRYLFVFNICDKFLKFRRLCLYTLIILIINLYVEKLLKVKSTQLFLVHVTLEQVIMLMIL